MESPTYKPTVPRRAQRQQVPLPTFTWHILRHKLILSKTAFKPTIWRHYIGDIFLPLGKSKSHIVAEFLRTSKLHHPTLLSLLLNSRPKYLYVTLRLCFRHCCICKGTRFNEKTILDVKTHFKQNENLPVHTFHLLSPTKF